MDYNDDTVTVMTEILDSDDGIWSKPQLKFWTLTMIHGHSDN